MNGLRQDGIVFVVVEDKILLSATAECGREVAWEIHGNLP